MARRKTRSSSRKYIRRAILRRWIRRKEERVRVMERGRRSRMQMLLLRRLMTNHQFLPL